MVGIKDVAEAAGVSIATVSRVLGNQVNVSPAVRERVMSAVEQLAYRPNQVARKLRSHQSRTIGLIVSDIRNSFFTAVSRAVEDAAYEKGYSVLLCNADENPEKEALYLNLMQDENVAGVIFSPTRQTLAQFKDLKLGFPNVIIDRTIKNYNVDNVLLDNVSAAYQLTTHLLENGYRRIGAIFDPVSTTSLERQQGYEEALQAYGLKVLPELIRVVAPQFEAAHAAARQLLSLPQPCEAILTCNSLFGGATLTAIRELNLAIPDQVALVSFDDATWTTLVQPAITVIAQPTSEIGRMATQLLLQRLSEPGRPTRKVILHGELIVRASSARRSSTQLDLPTLSPV